MSLERLVLQGFDANPDNLFARICDETSASLRSPLYRADDGSAGAPLPAGGICYFLLSDGSARHAPGETDIMSDVEDYPGPSHDHPAKKGQDPSGRADEGMVKPPARPKPKKEKSRKTLRPQ